VFFEHGFLKGQYCVLIFSELFGAVERKGMTLVPLSVYFNRTGRAKVELALAKGKQTHDKRASIKERDWKRDKARLMREKG
jgi:SsrA-binding protein